MSYNIAVIGTGYVGLVSGACFASTGNKVICVDIDESKVEKMKRGAVMPEIIGSGRLPRRGVGDKPTRPACAFAKTRLCGIQCRRG